MKSKVHQRTVISGALVFLSACVALFAVLDVSSGIRVLCVTGFLLVAPGYAVVSFWRPENKALEWSVAIAVSITITILVAVAMVLLSAWQPRVVVIVLAAVTAGALIVSMRRPVAAPAPAGTTW